MICLWLQKADREKFEREKLEKEIWARARQLMEKERKKQKKKDDSDSSEDDKKVCLVSMPLPSCRSVGC